LGRLNVPVLLVGGDRSPEFNKASLDGLQKCIRGAERVTIPTSHGLQLEDPDAFSRVVTQFLRKKQR
jgi:pimeloyl-ACP methyl ester carboxylesterase